eukprot:6211207-Pleurochrysis_carterae.AAC.1
MLDINKDSPIYFEELSHNIVPLRPLRMVYIVPLRGLARRSAGLTRRFAGLAEWRPWCTGRQPGMRLGQCV